MTILIGLSSLPFLHELIIHKDGTIFNWVPDLNIEKSLTDLKGDVLGYSSYRVFLYFFLIQLYTLIAWLGWFSVSKSKPYRLAILLGVCSSFYHIILILSNSRKTEFNNFEIKLLGASLICCVLFSIYYYNEKRKNRKLEAAPKKYGYSITKIIKPRIILIWLLIFIASTGPYFHNIITAKGIEVNEWIPQLGIENLLTDTEGKVWGFNSYRVFLLSLSLQVFAQVAWAGWLHDSAYKLYRPFLVAPVGLSLYQIVVILLDKTDASMNRPDIKLLFIFSIGTIICYFYFFRNKRLNSKITVISKVPNTAQKHIKN